jgi:hypothetical protein
MQIRKYLNENPLVGGAMAAGLVVIAIVFALWYTMSGGVPAPSTASKADPTKGFYSDDDGKSFFMDAVAKATPFKHGSKDAVRAYVFRCGSTTFVGLLGRNAELSRARPEGKMLGADYNAIEGAAATPAMFEIKKPSAAAWTPVTLKPGDPWHNMLAPECPGGGSDIPVPVIPGQQ